MYPIRFNNLYFEKIWGGRALESFRINMPKGNIGESWDIACHNKGIGIVQNGIFKGMTFKEIIKNYGNDILGDELSKEEFPLLVKLIDSNEKLSVQVHPNDEYAKINENSLGKTEFWYVIDAEEDASLIIGTKDCNKEIFKQAIKNGETEKYLNKVKVKKGDYFFVPSGLVHAICEGVVIAEIQQNSDITYRVYDYGRPRKVDIEKALDVIDFSLKSEKINENVFRNDNVIIDKICKCKYFNIDRISIKGEYKVNKEERYYIYTCVDGSGKVVGDEYIYELCKGESILIPAKLDEYKIVGELTLLKSSI